jgi:hypothetical protein
MFSQHSNSGISDSPVIQFKESNTDLLTIRLNINDSDWNQRKYIQFTKLLEKVNVKVESTRYVRSGSKTCSPALNVNFQRHQYSVAARENSCRCSYQRDWRWQAKVSTI